MLHLTKPSKMILIMVALDPDGLRGRESRVLRGDALSGVAGCIVDRC